ncbi:MAG: HNH endonuclease [Mesorhizobium amorphae]|nr:MAG: HNH endonuclease [Mesorhizobium amorphae]
MRTTLRTDITVRQITAGFEFDVADGKGLYGLAGRLVIQPEYQRNYIYGDGKRDVAVVESVLKGYPLGVIYFNRTGIGEDGQDRLEVLDGQQRITSLGRFVTGQFAIGENEGVPRIFPSLHPEERETILNAELLVYVCEGTSREIRDWFRTINIAGVPLNDQELLNAVYSGPFVTDARRRLSNGGDARVAKRSAFVRGNVRRQDHLETALRWAGEGAIEFYMSAHRHDPDAAALERHFDNVIEWADTTFPEIEKHMCGLDWDRLWREHGDRDLDVDALRTRVGELLFDPSVRDRAGVYEYVLGGESDPRLIDVRFFSEHVKRDVYGRQTDAAEERGVSNCPLCAASGNANAARIWKREEMEADHVAAWSRGGASDAANCEMLCRTHNRAKGNR